jgi:hypothetical protein
MHLMNVPLLWASLVGLSCGPLSWASLAGMHLPPAQSLCPPQSLRPLPLPLPLPGASAFQAHTVYPSHYAVLAGRGPAEASHGWETCRQLLIN